jgi:hypothetical protein
VSVSVEPATGDADGSAGTRPTGVDLAIGFGFLTLLAAAGVIVLVPDRGVTLAAMGVVVAVVAAASAAILYRRPWLAPYGVILIFVTSGELRLRLTPTVGALKDLYVVLLVVCVALYAIRRPSTLRPLRVLAFPGAAIGVLLAMYVVDPGGGHGPGWLFGIRLLVEALVLFVVGFLLAPQESVKHLVRAVTAMLPVQAVLAWLQQAAGSDDLVFRWGYQYGGQVRVTGGGVLRSFGTFEDAFQLATFALLGMALALFVASRWQAAVLLVSALAVLGATSVRTTVVQVAVLAFVWAVRRGWWRPAVAVCAVGAVAGTFLLATTTTAVRPGAPEEPLLLTLNGRTTAWGLAVDGWESLLVGNGVAARGVGSGRSAEGLVVEPPQYDPTSEPRALFSGDPSFLDSAYAQVQSDVGLVGTAALLTGIAALAAHILRQCRRQDRGADWAACAVLSVSLVDWFGRSTLASYTTGFLILYMLGMLVGSGVGRPSLELSGTR